MGLISAPLCRRGVSKRNRSEPDPRQHVSTVDSVQERKRLQVRALLGRGLEGDHGSGPNLLSSC